MLAGATRPCCPNDLSKMLSVHIPAKDKQQIKKGGLKLPGDVNPALAKTMYLTSKGLDNPGAWVRRDGSPTLAAVIAIQAGWEAPKRATSIAKERTTPMGRKMMRSPAMQAIGAQGDQAPFPPRTPGIYRPDGTPYQRSQPRRPRSPRRSQRTQPARQALVSPQRRRVPWAIVEAEEEKKEQKQARPARDVFSDWQSTRGDRIRRNTPENLEEDEALDRYLGFYRDPKQKSLARGFFKSAFSGTALQKITIPRSIDKDTGARYDPSPLEQSLINFAKLCAGHSALRADVLINRKGFLTNGVQERADPVIPSDIIGDTGMVNDFLMTRFSRGLQPTLLTSMQTALDVIREFGSKRARSLTLPQLMAYPHKGPFSMYVGQTIVLNKANSNGFTTRVDDRPLIDRRLAYALSYFTNLA